MRRWIVWLAVVGSMVMVSSGAAATDPATPCAGSNPLSGGTYTYEPKSPIILSGTENATATIDFSMPSGEYVSFHVVYSGNDRFEAKLIAPSGDEQQLFAAIHPDGTNFGTPIREQGTFTVTVESNGPWAVIVS